VSCLEMATPAVAARYLDAALACLKEYRIAEATGADVVSSLANLAQRIRLLLSAGKPG
jgi:hypothetical protein